MFDLILFEHCLNYIKHVFQSEQQILNDNLTHLNAEPLYGLGNYNLVFRFPV